MSTTVIENLMSVLANNYFLYLKTQNYHWNIRGSHFHSLHLLFEASYQDLAEAIDTIAERIRALNAPVPATFKDFERLRLIQDGEAGKSWEEMVKDLLEGHKTVIKLLKACFETATAAKDDATADLMIERIRKHEKDHWMLNATLNNV